MAAPSRRAVHEVNGDKRALMTLVVLLALAQTFSEPAALSADPDSAVGEIGWQSSLRAKAGLPLHIVELGHGPWFFLSAPSFLELSNEPGSGSFVPSQYWRARIQVEGGAAFQLGQRLSLSTALRLEHESDHPTASYSRYAGGGDYGYVAYNALALVVGLTLQQGRNAVFFTAVARAHLVTCTRDPEECGRGGGTSGDRSFEPTVSLGYQRILYSEGALCLDAFASVFGQYIVPNGLVLEERRFTAKAGVGLRRTRLGRFYAYASAWLGTQGGYLRTHGDVAQWGFGIGWTP